MKANEVKISGKKEISTTELVKLLKNKGVISENEEKQLTNNKAK